MRPVRLTLQAFGPYPDRQVIDFRKAVEAGLFGIYGQTGSGKSTIFSAMTFALFGAPAKAEQAPASLRSDHADPARVTEVEFVFDLRGKRYVVLRRPEQPRPKTRGEGTTASPHEAFLFDATGRTLEQITEGERGKILAEKKVGEVDRAVQELLGYKAEQFRQIVLLPQGRFETFLAANTKERLRILRELFDVSLYEALMAELKARADAEKARLRLERELAGRQLQAEGFAGGEELTQGIAAAEALVSEAEAAEAAALSRVEGAAQALREGVSVADRFRLATETAARLATLQAEAPAMEALADHLAEADRAARVLDVEAYHLAAEATLATARDLLARAGQGAQAAAEAEARAALALQAEQDRAEEVEALRRRADDLDRHALRLDEASEGAAALDAARREEAAAQQALSAAQAALDEAQATRTAQEAALTAARAAATLRAEAQGRRSALQARLEAALAHERGQAELVDAEARVQRQAETAATLTDRAALARADRDAAEAALAGAQAVHLASRLSPGAPCPVCGATDHPAPASGEIGAAGLDQAFRTARTAWEAADQAARRATETLAALKATLSERQSRQAALPPPEGSEALTVAVKAEEAALKALGPALDLEAAALRLEEGAAALARLADTRAACEARVQDARLTVAELAATLTARLQDIPADLRDPKALATARQDARAALSTRLSAREAAERAARSARDTALGAAKDLEAAQGQHLAATEALRKAEATLVARLQDTGLSLVRFLSLKPALASREADRIRLETWRREHHGARLAADQAAQATQGLAPPDLDTLRTAEAQARAALTAATETRLAARARLGHLCRLRDTLAETLRQLEEAEAASAPLRDLADLVNGDNSQRLTLETFAIGAMFDRVLASANLRLAPMTAGRYRLDRDAEGGRGARGLGIEVFDLHTGRARATSTLSGGETFIAALALALGLADVVEGVSGNVRLDTIFIDEGFGSLDTENGAGTLDQVLQVLNGIVKQNRAVGLISHVPLVQEMIPNGFHVRKGLSGSQVEERGGD